MPTRKSEQVYMCGRGHSILLDTVNCWTQ